MAPAHSVDHAVYVLYCRYCQKSPKHCIVGPQQHPEHVIIDIRIVKKSFMPRYVHTRLNNFSQICKIQRL